MQRRLADMLLELLGKLKRRMEAKDVGDFLNGTRGAQEKLLGLLETHLTMILLWAQTDALGKCLPKMRIAYPEFTGNCGQTQALLATERDQCVRPLDQFIDTTIKSRTALQIADHR